MRKVHPKVLLVEGDEEKRVLPQFIEANGIPWGKKPEEWIVQIKSCNGYEGVVAPGLIETHLKESGLKALGIIVDADADARSRWQAIRDRCGHIFADLPAEIPEGGLIVEDENHIRFGAWIMPDNRAQGMLETFLAFLRPDANNALLQLTEETYQKARAVGAPCKEVHADKARIYTWLAWQDPPGRQLHQAIMEKILQPGSPHGAPFVRWFRALFSV